MFDPHRFITQRVQNIDASGIRRVFDLGASLSDPVNLSIGQPDFDVPESVKQVAIHAIQDGFNGYTVTQGIPELRQKIRHAVCDELPNWRAGVEDGAIETLITSGVSGGLVLALLTCVGQGDEVLVPDPYFVMYRHLISLCGASPVYVDTYPDFQLTAERIEPLITRQTKLLLFNSPSNPTGAVASNRVCREIAELASQHGLLLLCDEIYDQFCYQKVPRKDGAYHCPSPAAYCDQLLLLRGFSKTYGMPGWRLGYVAGPAPIVEQMTKLQQYSFVCAPSMAQLAAVAAMDLDMSAAVDRYCHRRDRVVNSLSDAFELTTPEGAFYAFPKVPDHLGIDGTTFVERAIASGLLIIPGSVFSNRDTHFRLSYACDDQMLDRGLEILLELARA